MGYLLNNNCMLSVYHNSGESQWEVYEKGQKRVRIDNPEISIYIIVRIFGSDRLERGDTEMKKDDLIVILIAVGMIVLGIFGLTVDASEYEMLFLGMRFGAAIPTLLGSILAIWAGGYLLYILLKDYFKKK